ncbi:MAG: hypothetical protein AAGF82_08690 [Pseudomonadota bacterium]
MFGFSRITALTLVLFAAPTAAHAATVSNAGTIAGGPDFVSSGGGALVDAAHRAYVPNSSASAWVWDSNRALSPVTFTHSFDLTGYDIGTASLSGVWGVDNFGTARLNGIVISSIPFGYPAFQSLTAYAATSGFVAGLNTLSFKVTNLGAYSSRNPAAFRAEALVTATPVPLPAPLALLAGGLGMLGLAGWRRKRAAA